MLSGGYSDLSNGCRLSAVRVVNDNYLEKLNDENVINTEVLCNEFRSQFSSILAREILFYVVFTPFIQIQRGKKMSFQCPRLS